MGPRRQYKDFEIFPKGWPNRYFLLPIGRAYLFTHNHPSGDPEASEDDIELTKRLATAGEIVGIDVLDHIIICDKKYLSLKREGLF